jgi:hypothetical protein
MPTTRNTTLTKQVATLKDERDLALRRLDACTGFLQAGLLGLEQSEVFWQAEQDRNKKEMWQLNEEMSKLSSSLKTAKFNLTLSKKREDKLKEENELFTKMFDRFPSDMDIFSWDKKREMWRHDEDGVSDDSDYDEDDLDCIMYEGVKYIFDEKTNELFSLHPWCGPDLVGTWDPHCCHINWESSKWEKQHENAVAVNLGELGRAALAAK